MRVVDSSMIGSCNFDVVTARCSLTRVFTSFTVLLVDGSVGVTAIVQRVRRLLQQRVCVDIRRRSAGRCTLETPLPLKHTVLLLLLPLPFPLC